MLIKITDYREMDPRKLMDVYSESNYENTDYFFMMNRIRKPLFIRLKKVFWIF